MKRKVPVKVRVWVTETQRSSLQRSSTGASWGAKLFTVTILASAVGLVIIGSWLAVRLIINPASLTWLSHLLPTWSDFYADQPQTLDEIKAKIGEINRTTAQLIHLSTYPGMTQQQLGFHDVLLPVVSPLKHCGHQAKTQAGPTQSCAEIVELRIYRPTARPNSSAKQMTYELVDQIIVTGPEELTAIAPLTHAASAITHGSTRTLPLTQISFVNGTAPDGIWFHLSGEWKRGSRVLYGQVIQFDPQRNRLYSVQSWSSPAGQLPRWQQVTGNPTAELVVDQSIGLEPQFQVYQLKPARSLAQSVTLEAITLTEAALGDRTYTNGLLMARHGLWSPAVQLLTTAKQTGNWSAAAQAQLDLVTLHAKVTQTQAQRDWASPTQQILAQVMDGRWSKALSLLKSAHESGYDVRNLLSTNADRFWQRIETALRVHPRQGELQEWGMLILAVRQNREQAVAWLRSQPTVSAPAKRTIEETLALLQPSPSPSSPMASVPTATSATSVSVTPAASPKGLIGSVTPVANVRATDWLMPTATALSLASNQRWYQVDVVGMENNQQGQRPLLGLEVSSTSTAQQAQQLWEQLGLTDPQLQIVAWQGATSSHTLFATVKAFQINNGQLSLLAVGETLPMTIAPSAIVAITPSTVSWAQPSTVVTLAELAQQRPIWKTTLIPQLWQDLQAAGLVFGAEANDPLQTIGPWSVQLMELTGDQKPEVVLTIEAAGASSPRTMIFSGQDSVLYSDLQASDQSLVAIADRGSSPLSTLIIKTAQGISLQHWSKQNLRFESVILPN